MPSFRSSTISALRQRTVSGENGSVNGIPSAFTERLALAQDAVVPRGRLDDEADRFEPAGLAHVLPHGGCGSERQSALPAGATTAAADCKSAAPCVRSGGNLRPATIQNGRAQDRRE
jgi:hypothetical protein